METNVDGDTVSSYGKGVRGQQYDYATTFYQNYSVYNNAKTKHQMIFIDCFFCFFCFVFFYT